MEDTAYDVVTLQLLKYYRSTLVNPPQFISFYFARLTSSID